MERKPTDKRNKLMYISDFSADQFALRLQNAMEEAGVSTKDLFKYLHVDKNTIYKFRSGQQLPNAHMLYDLSRILNVSSDYLVGLKKCRSTSHFLSNAESDLIHMYRFLPAVIKKDASHLLHKLYLDYYKDYRRMEE